MSAVLQPTDTPSAANAGIPANDAAIPVPPLPEGDPKPKARKKADPVEAAKRLAESRERLRLYMVDPDGRLEARRRATEAAEASGTKLGLFERLRTHPSLGVVVDLAESWWTRHPLHPVASLAEGAVRDRVGPAVRRHPIAAVAGAVALGAAIVWFRPWRWLKAPARAAGSASHSLMRLLGSLPIASILAAYSAVAQKRAHDARDDAEEARDETVEVVQQAQDEGVPVQVAPAPGAPAAPAATAAPASASVH